MPITIPPQVALNEFLGATTRHTRRIEIYESDGRTRWSKDTEVRLKGGTISVDYDRDERRTLDLVLSNDDGVLVNAPGEFWYDKIIKVFRGVKVNQPGRLPRIVILGDKTGENQLAQSFRSRLVTLGYGDVRIDQDAASWGEVSDADIFIGVGGATETQRQLLQQAYDAGRSVFVQDEDASNWYWDRFGPHISTINLGEEEYVWAQPDVTHPVGSGWQWFYPTLNGRKNRFGNPRPFTDTAGWWVSPGESIAYVTDGGEGAIELTDPVGGGGGYVWKPLVDAWSPLPGVGRWVSVAMDVKALHTVIANGMRIIVRFVKSGVQHGSQYSFNRPVNANEWTRIEASFEMLAEHEGADGIRIFVWPSASSPVGAQFRTRRWHAAHGDDEANAVAMRGEYFDYLFPPDDLGQHYIEGSPPESNASLYYPTAARAFLIESPDWTPIAFTYSNEDLAILSAMQDSTRGGRAVIYTAAVNKEQYEVPEFVNMLTSIFKWLDTVVPVTTWETQIGEFMIDRISEPHFPKEVRITGRDYTKKCMASKFTEATQFASGLSMETIIAAVAGSAGIVKRNLPNTGVVVGRDFFFDRGMSRWEAMKEVATAYDYELYFDASGHLTMRQFLDPTTSAPVVWINTGPGGELVSFEKSTSDSRLYNSILVTGESSDSSVLPVYAKARNTTPGSPTSIDRIGERLYEYTSSFITTTTQAQDLANTLLGIHSLEEFELRFESLVLPWLEAGDIIGFVDPNRAPDDPTTFLLSTISIGLELGPMSATAKRLMIAS